MEAPHDVFFASEGDPLDDNTHRPAGPGSFEEEPLREGEIRAQLQRIFASEDFAGSAQLANFLRFVIDEYLAGRTERIKERTIAIHVLKRGNQFDPRIDSSVRTAAGALRRALGRYYAMEGIFDPVRIDVPKGGYRPVITPVTDDASEVTSSAATSDTSQIGAVKLPSRILEERGAPTLAVLPFAILDNKEQTRFLAESIPLDVSVRLAGSPLLSVIDFMLTRHLLGKPFEPRQIVADLHADHLLMGSVRSRGRRAHVSFQLTHGASGVQLWASSMDATVGSEAELFLEDIVATIVAAVGDVYGAVADALGHNCKAKELGELSPLEAVVRHFQFQCQFVLDNCPAVIEIVQRAVQADPQFGWGWSALAHLHLESFACLAEVPDASDRAWTYILEALSINPTDVYAHWVQGLYYTFHGMPEEMARAMERTIEYCDGAPFLLGAAGVLLSATAEYRHGVELLDRATQLNRRQPGWFRWGAFLSRYRLEQYDEALGTSEGFSLPGAPWDALFRSAALAQQGRTEEARLQLQHSVEIQPAFAQRPREGLQRLLIDHQLRDHVLEGLRLAGLPAA